MSEVQELRSALEALTARVRALEDELALRRLAAEYGPAADSGDAGAAAGLWTEDGVYDVAGRFRLEGRGQIAAMLNGGHQQLVRHGCAHVLTAPVIDLDGDEARGRGYALNLRWDAAIDGFRVALASACRWRWVRTGEGWRVTERTNANLDGTPDHRALLAPDPTDDSEE